MHANRHVVTVVIPTLGRGSLARTFDALTRQSRPPDEVLQIIDQDRRGVAWGRNEGIRRAEGDLIAFTDADCVPGPEWLATLIEAIDRHDADGAGGNRRCFEATAARDGFVCNESFPSAEDWELVYHLRSRGARLIYVPFEVDHLRTARRDLIGICAGGWLELRSWLARRP